jgi:hypothetical protein
MWELANGLDTEPLHRTSPREHLSEALEFDSPIVTIDGLLAAVQIPLGRLTQRLRKDALALRLLRIRATLSGQRTWERQVSTKIATADPAELLTLLRPVMERHEWTSGILGVEMVAGDICVAGGVQPDLWSIERNGVADRIAAALRQLEPRYRRLPVYRVVTTDGKNRIPERRFSLVSYLPSARTPEMRPLRTITSVDVESTEDGVPTRVRCNEGWRRVLTVQSEFRLKDEWWSLPISRRYFRVVADNGRRLTIFVENGSWYISP